MEQGSSETYYIGSVKVEKECILKIDSYMSTNQKFNAKKCVREISGLGLAAAKTLVENYKSYDLDELQKINTTTVSSLQSTNKLGDVAIAVYGSYDCPKVWTLRRYRDNVLIETWYGRAFIKTYYAISPTFVKWFGHTEWFKKIWKGKLDHMVAELQANGIESTPYEDRSW